MFLREPRSPKNNRQTTVTSPNVHVFTSTEYREKNAGPEFAAPTKLKQGQAGTRSGRGNQVEDPQTSGDRGKKICMRAGLAALSCKG